jgi:hypothetical protein
MAARALIPGPIKPFGRRALAELEYWSQKALGRADPLLASVSRLSEEWRSIRDHVPEPPPDGKQILFATGNGLNATALSMETFLMAALRLRGHDCVSLICDRGLPSCEFNRTGIGEPPAGTYSRAFSRGAAASMCVACSTAAAAAVSSIGAEVRRLHEFGEPSDYARARAIVDSVDPRDIRAYRYRGILVGDHAFSSTLRQTLRGTVDLENPEELWTYRRQLLSTIVMVERFSRCLDELEPDKVVLVHGVYLTHGTAAEICGKRGIDVVVYGVPYRKGTIWLSHDETYHRSLVSEPADHWEQLELTDEMNRTLDDYLASKTAGGRDNVNYHPNPVVERDPIVQELGLDPSVPIISLFTNVVWDAQIYYHYNAFEDIFDWLYSTIEYFGSRPELQLVIRIHPAETKGGLTTRQPLLPELRRRFPVLPANVFVIPSESAISSYTVAEMSRAALIYGTKMGLEIAIRRIPVVVAGETFNRGKGFTYDAETRDQYFSLLDGIEELPRNSDEMVERARRFAYYLFFMRMIDMPLLSTDLHKVIRAEGQRFFSFDTLDALRPGHSRNLDVVCDGIVERTPFVAAPDPALSQASMIDAMAFEPRL